MELGQGTFNGHFALINNLLFGKVCFNRRIRIVLYSLPLFHTVHLPWLYRRNNVETLPYFSRILHSKRTHPQGLWTIFTNIFEKRIDFGSQFNEKSIRASHKKSKGRRILVSILVWIWLNGFWIRCCSSKLANWLLLRDKQIWKGWENLWHPLGLGKSWLLYLLYSN